MLQILIPVSDDKIFFPKEEYFFPKPIIEVLNKPLIIQVISHLEKILNPERFIFVIPRDLEDSFSLSNIIELSASIKTKFFIRKGETSGGLSSCLLASDLIEDGEVIVANMDEIIDVDLNETIKIFRKKNASAGVISYESSHPRWSYAIINSKNEVGFCAEKKVISKNALAGFYYFQSRDIFIDSCSKVLLEDNSLDGNFYLSSAINQIILMQKVVYAFQIKSSYHHSLFSSEMIKEFEKSSFAKNLIKKQDYNESINIVIPAAGKGSRFSKANWSAPKPFIDINGKPMLQHVVDNLAIKNSNIHLVLQESHITKYNPKINGNIANSINKISIDFNTAGTACTVLHALNHIKSGSGLLIANSDQIVDFDCDLFIQDAINRNLDGSILVFRDFEKDPKWSFVRVDKFELVKEVAEKKAISDLATVGIYFFKSADDFREGAIDMISHDDRVNNEFYTCPIYNYLIKKNKKIGIYEINPSAMHGIGTPEDLIIYQNSKNYPPSSHSPN